MPDLAAVAKETYQVLRTYNYTMQLYDEDNNDVTEPEDARRFWTPKRNLFITLSDDDENSEVILHFGKSIDVHNIAGLIQQLRTMSTKYNMIFNLQRSDDDISPRNFPKLMSVSETRKHTMHVLEGVYGTSRSSYLRMESAKMIIRHRKRIDDSKLGARSRCIESILVENGAGERFLFPTRDLAPARAMTQHVNQGGTFADQVGQQIINMSYDYADLATASHCLNAAEGTPMAESAGQVREACRGKMRNLRKTFERLYRPSTYAAESESLLNAANMLAETGAVQIDETRISEMRQLLNDVDLPKRVYECMCRAVDETKQEPMTEETPELAERAPAIVEFMQWTSRFSPDRALKEFFDPNMDMSDPIGNAEDQALMDFDAQEFLDSPEMEEVLGGRNVDDPEKHQLQREPIMSALRNYFQSFILNSLDPGYDADTDDLAEQVYPEVVELLQNHGFVVNDAALHDDALQEHEELTREDILLPPENQGLSLKGEVVPAEVDDPDHPGEKTKPDGDYINRLQTLAGINAAPSAQTYLNQ